MAGESSIQPGLAADAAVDARGNGAGTTPPYPGRWLRQRSGAARTRSHLAGRTAVRPTESSLEDPMSTLKSVRSYARYLASSLATVAFAFTLN